MAGTSAKEHKQAHSSLLDTLLRPIDSPRFSTYSYSCIDQALLRKLQLWVTLKLLVYVPTWVSPHLLTMVGSAAILPGVIGVAVYSADGCNTQIGLWLTLTGLGGIVWDILDNLDGKQARRTGTSSILGDFLDHTLDYITLAGMLYVFATGICMGCDQFSMIFFMLGLVAHECVVWTTWWGRRFSGILFLGAVGQTEAVILFGVGLLQTAYAGGEWWLTPALDIGATVLGRGHCIAGVIIAAFLIVAPVSSRPPSSRVASHAPSSRVASHAPQYCVASHAPQYCVASHAPPSRANSQESPSRGFVRIDLVVAGDKYL